MSGVRAWCVFPFAEKFTTKNNPYSVQFGRAMRNCNRGFPSWRGECAAVARAPGVRRGEGILPADRELGALRRTGEPPRHRDNPRDSAGCHAGVFGWAHRDCQFSVRTRTFAPCRGRTDLRRTVGLARSCGPHRHPRLLTTVAPCGDANRNPSSCPSAAAEPRTANQPCVGPAPPPVSPRHPSAARTPRCARRRRAGGFLPLPERGNTLAARMDWSRTSYSYSYSVLLSPPRAWTERPSRRSGDPG